MLNAALLDGRSDDAPAATISRSLTLLFAVSVGVIVTNLFASQTLVGVIGASLGLQEGAAGFVAMASLLGYSAGLFLLVPLADLTENRSLVVRLLSGAVLAAACTTLVQGAGPLLASLFLLGACCSAIQVLVPVAASMAAPEHRGQVIGDVMSGLMVGILLSRPVASLLADAVGWRGFYGGSAAAMALLTAVLARKLPRRAPAGRTSYPALIASLWQLLRDEPVLRRRSLTASLAMASFSLFWTSIALKLAQPPYDLGQRGVALFALVGAGGAVVTPIFGRAGDRGWTRPATVAAHVLIVGSLLIAAWAPQTGSATVSLALLGLTAVLLDVGTTGDQTLGRRSINLLNPEARGRINGLFVGLFFLGGAVGSSVAGVAWSWGGWTAVCLVGAGFGAMTLALDVLAKPVRG
ncbi:MFS transporter [Alsobacter sp. KACC 23698]|uniref:MFS transporter n=1 Tax=Alsobacter sp. KACC 23698 TaxID=3149229 RepID=A0AAU7JDC3_9HYPH